MDIEEPVDTSNEAPAEAVGSTEADATEQNEQALQEEAAPQTPPPLTPDEIIQRAEERAFQRTASWMGRRDRELIDNVTNMIDQKMRSMIPPQPAPASDPTQLLENPDLWAEQKIPQIIDRYVATRTQAEQSYMANVIKNAGGMMDSDPLFADKDFGAEVIAEVQKQIGHIDKRQSPDIAARLLVNDAIAAVYRQKTSVKTHPLGGNVPGKAPAGQTPPVGNKGSSPKMPKLSDVSMRMVKQWNYDPETVAKLMEKAT
jgi:hypothetical protein